MMRQGKSIHTRFEVFMAVNVLCIVFWVVPLCGLVSGDRYFRGIFCLHPQGQSKLVTSMGTHNYERFISQKRAMSTRRERSYSTPSTLRTKQHVLPKCWCPLTHCHNLQCTRPQSEGQFTFHCVQLINKKHKCS
jgi:hypothetical protein